MRNVNLLPWRQRQRQRTIRFWSLLFPGAFLLALVIALSLHMEEQWRQQSLQARLSSDRIMQSELERRHAQWRELNARYQEGQQALAGREKTAAWQRTLLALAQAIPPQAWLTELRFHHPRLIVNGYATTLSALTAFSQALGRLPGFTPGPAGELRQDDEGRWRFSFTLQQKE
ncbi:PilN domain-containing protein [Pseudenterobacter timonensis]|uniref:PilN domain-containing protein n=1 Tax=Pseudenterobacter timonensis TaxID=1755099 RepID=A0ABV4ACC9_9ENTR